MYKEPPPDVYLYYTLNEKENCYFSHVPGKFKIVYEFSKLSIISSMLVHLHIILLSNGQKLENRNYRLQCTYNL